MLVWVWRAFVGKGAGESEGIEGPPGQNLPTRSVWICTCLHLALALYFRNWNMMKENVLWSYELYFFPSSFVLFFTSESLDGADIQTLLNQ